MISRFIAAALAVLTLGLAAPALAQDGAVSLKGEVKVVRQTTATDGRTSETLEEPTQVLPGDRLRFTTRYTNGGSQPATDFVVVNPLPAPVRLAKADGLEVSVDRGRTFGALTVLTVAQADGTSRPAALDDVTHVRWRFATIAPGASGDVTYFGEVR